MLTGVVACATTVSQGPALDPTEGQPPAQGAQADSGRPSAPASNPDAESASPAPPAVSGEVTPDRTRRGDPPGAVTQVHERMDEAYENGLEAYRAGRFDEAKELFDQAVDVVLSSGFNLSEYPGLKGAFDDMVRNIADLDAELYSQAPGAEAGETASPLDSLKDITTYLSPEEADKERDRIQKVVGHITYDIPITLHPKVLAYIEAFQTRIRSEFEAGLKRSGHYLPLIKSIFREEGLPEDLVYMAHQESAFKTSAYSRARAKGMWQFMSFTGRKYGLKIDPWIDERSDFEKATRAAASYLRDLYARYGDWYLAMAAYNAGEGKIDRAVARARSKDFWTIARTRYIRAETKSYVPAILASILIDKSPADYGFDVDTAAPLRWDVVEIDKPTDLQVIAEGCAATLEEIRFLNPELRGLLTPPNRSSYRVRVPSGSKEAILAHLQSLPDDKRVSWTVHETKPGETFTTVARRYKVPVRALIEANPRYANRKLRHGTALNVPLVAGAPVAVAAVATEDRPTYEAGERVVHRVRKGDTLHSLSGKYRTTVANLKRWNNLQGTVLRPGRRLVAYYGEKGDGPTVEAEAPVTVAGGRIEYRVQQGDTLNSIARKFSATLDDLLRWNTLTLQSIIRPGDRLWVGEAPAAPTVGTGRPGPSGASAAGQGRIEHRVRRGDTLHQIAQRYDVTVNQVRNWNGIDKAGTIYPGQILRIYQQ
ncbi:MAG TPA: LysM peptidoglycan-binding domain-containing protein [Candidatus Cryosericum sp.]|nr:LysM peptidoglycan-binding domain-containing protein [Candidatus Cryosericum sp.]